METLKVRVRSWKCVLGHRLVAGGVEMKPYLSMEYLEIRMALGARGSIAG